MKLSEIQYQRPNMDTLKQTLENLCTQFQNAKNVETQLEVVHQVNELQLDFHSHRMVAEIRNDLNSFDKFYDKESDFFDEQEPVFKTHLSPYYQLLLNSPFRNTLEQKLGKQLFKKAQFFIEERNKQTESIDQELNRLESEYFKTLSQGTVTFQGKEYPLRAVGKFGNAKDIATRKAAKDAFFDFWASKEEGFHHLFDEMVQLRDKKAKALGLENCIEESYHNSDYNGEQVSTFNKAVLKYFIPLNKRLYERTLKRRNIEQMYYYDMTKYKNGNPKLQINEEELWANTKKMYAELSPETDEFCQFMLENELFDTEVRKGKYGGAYMASIKKHGLPFILANFTESSDDFRILVHEMGHAFQKHQTHKAGIRQIEYLGVQSDIAEIHAIGMELFTWDWYSLFFKEDTPKFQFSKISQMLNSIVSNCCTEAFQQFIYRNPKASPAERNQKWLELEKSYYPYHTEAIYDDNAYLRRGSDWQSSPHIMCRPFYAVDYSLANLCAFQFWMKSKENKEETWNDYLKLCKVGGKHSYFEALQSANLRSPF
ncbi:MAG: M3 family oligoendopeptidase, partial [Chitinophagales bacterium]